MRKSTNYNTVVSIFKDSFASFPIPKLRAMQQDNTLKYEARIAVRELLREKEVLLYNEFATPTSFIAL